MTAGDVGGPESTPNEMYTVSCAPPVPVVASAKTMSGMRSPS